MAGVTILGTAFRPDIEWMRDRAASQWPTVLERLSESDRKQLEIINALGRYPVALFGAVTAAFVEVVCMGSRERAATEFNQMSRSVGEAQFQGVYSTILKVSSPEGTLKRVASLGPRVFEGSTASVEFPASGSPNAILRLNGLEEIDYAGPGLSGFLAVAIEKTGARSVRVRERMWEMGFVRSSTLEFEVSWS